MNHKQTAALLAAFTLTFSAAAAADGLGEGTGPYIQGDIGLAKVKTQSEFRSIKQAYDESTLLPRASVGYDFGQFRAAADYTHYGKIDDGKSGAYASTKAQGLGVSAVYDFDAGQFQPYVGARASLNHIKRTESHTGYSSSDRRTKAGIGVLAGVGYQLNDSTTLDAGYRYNHFEKDLKAHEATVGVRYKF